MLPDKPCVQHKWEKYENKQASGSSQYKEAKTIQQCLDYCASIANCVGVDVNKVHDPPSCWPHFRTSQLSDDDAFDRTGINQYRLVERCENALTAAASTAGTSPTLYTLQHFLILLSGDVARICKRNISYNTHAHTLHGILQDESNSGTSFYGQR